MVLVAAGMPGEGWTVTLSGEATGAVAVSPSAATAQLRFNTDGTVEEDQGGGFVQIDSATDWIIPNSAADSTFEIRLTVDTGATPSGAATATWLDLGTARTWSLTQSGEGSTTGDYTIEIRRSGNVLASGAYTLTATVTAV